jgi:ribosomal protein S18 acetylase RimI-like enzyme
VTIRPYEPEWSDAVRLAHNEAFARHWGFQPWTAQAWEQWETGHRDFHPEWSFVAFDRLGIAGYLLSAGYEADWAADGFTQGWTNKLGVRPDRRKQGLAAALLGRAMNAYREAGMQYAGLDVDAENTTNAVSLYTKLGYEVRHTTATWLLDL